MSTLKPITLCVESFEDEAGYVAWIDNEKFKGMVVQSNTFKGVLEELFTSIKVKFAYDYGITLGGVEEKIEAMIKEFQQIPITNCEGKREINLKFA